MLLPDASKCYFSVALCNWSQIVVTHHLAMVDYPCKEMGHALRGCKWKCTGSQVSQFQTLTNSTSETMSIYVRGKAYSGDLRWRVVFKRCLEGKSTSTVSRELSVSSKFVRKIIEIYNRTGDVNRKLLTLQKECFHVRIFYQTFHELNETCHSVIFYFMKKTHLLYQQEMHFTKYDQGSSRPNHIWLKSTFC